MAYAIVTGATQGIGKAIAEKLLREGFSIAICARSGAKLLSLQKEWQERYPDATIMAVEADLSIREQVGIFAQAVLEKFPVIDVLVNNAGTYLPGILAEEEEGQLEKMIGVNLYSAYWLTRLVLPAMLRAGSGHIFNMCSVASLRAYPNGGSYSISKYALLGFSDNLREELKLENIRVTSVCPGATYTPSWEGSGVEKERIMEAEDVATMVWSAFNLSARANVETIVMKPVKGDL